MTYTEHPGDPYVETPTAPGPVRLVGTVEWRLDPRVVEVHAVVDGDLVTLCGDPAPLSKIIPSARPDGRPYIPVCTRCIELTRALSTSLEYYLRPQPAEATWVCVYGRCEGASFTGTAAAAAAWMDQHVVDHPHDSRWSVSFRIDYPGRDLPGVAYRTAVTL